MQRNRLVAIVFSIVVLTVGFACESKVSAAEETDILKITVGEPTKLTSQTKQNTANLTMSRTGVVAVLYEKPRTLPRFCRVSTDGGRTWSQERDGPKIWGGAQSVSLRDGGAIKIGQDPTPSLWEEGVYDMVTYRFTDDFMSWERGTAKLYVPYHIIALEHVPGPSPAKGKIIQMPDGDLLMPMYGCFEGDRSDLLRAYLVRSTDQGRTWLYYATIAHEQVDPNPELPGHYLGSCEPSFVLLPNGQMLAMLRTQYSHVPGEYRPMYVCWSNNLGKTWTRPIPTKPHLMCISPTLQVLDNGVVACVYGRPGFHVAFSLDNGHTWQDHISFSDLPVEVITGQFDMIKVGPNKLVAVGSDAEGTRVWPISVERLKVSPARVALTGRVLDQQGNPIAQAKVERSPNRYALDCWLEGTGLDVVWRGSPVTIGSPVLGYRSIQKQYGHPTVQTDAQGRFLFDSVKLGEYVLTVEADDYAPQHRHIKVGPQVEGQEFRLKPGRKICNRVVDDHGQPVGGACVVLNRWHVHTDRAGFFHWSVEAPLPEKVSIRVYKGWRGPYHTLKEEVSLLQLERRPIITLTRKK